MSPQAKQRQRTRLVPGVAVVALLVASLIGVAIWQGSKPSDDAAIPDAVAQIGDGLPVGDGPATVEVYSDFLCPACKVFDEAARPMLDAYLAEGMITLVYHPIAILNRASSTEYSTRSAAAAGCAADGGKVDEFFEVMMRQQPTEGGAGLSDDEIVEIGAGIGLPQDTFGQCVTDGRYHEWADSSTDAAADNGVSGTPTVLVDGVPPAEMSLRGLAEAIETAAASG